jgi:hypothetical protein
MRFHLRKTGVILALPFSIIFGSSCEKHHVGELPPEPTIAQADQPRPAAAPATSASPTPVEFFPTSTPR